MDPLSIFVSYFYNFNFKVPYLDFKLDYLLNFNIALLTVSVIFFAVVEMKDNLNDGLKRKKEKFLYRKKEKEKLRKEKEELKEKVEGEIREFKERLCQANSVYTMNKKEVKEEIRKFKEETKVLKKIEEEVEGIKRGLKTINLSLNNFNDNYRRILDCFKYSLHSNIIAIILIICLDCVGKFTKLSSLTMILIVFFIVLSVHCICKNVRRVKYLCLFDIDSEIKKDRKDRVDRKIYIKKLSKAADFPELFRAIEKDHKKNKLVVYLNSIRNKSSDVYNSLFN